jgi:hypothetical protein
MLPAKPRFDARPAIARLQTDSTSMLRQMYPNLDWAWDELDELREGKDDRADALDKILYSVENGLRAVLDDMDHLQPVDPNPLEGLRKELDDLLTRIEDERAGT